MMKTRIELLEQLEEELTALRCRAYRAYSKEEFLSLLNSLLDTFPSPKIALENRPWIQSLDLDAHIMKENRHLLHLPSKERRKALRENNWEAAHTVQIGIGGADYALADTGTLVLFSSSSGGRWISLTPTVHICLLPIERILPSLDDLFPLLAQEENGTALGSAITFITGPSRTADIELTLVMGAHGPKELHVITLLF
jgi:L-lactate dehydrogenase complex protein LldG